MKRNHYLILGGIALIGGYLWYRHEKSEKARKALVKTTTPLSSNMSGEYYESLRNIPEQYISDRDAIKSMSNVSGTSCTCDNGFTGYCQSGDCSKCCASYNDKKRPTETRTYTFMKQSQRPSRAYGSAY